MKIKPKAGGDAINIHTSAWHKMEKIGTAKEYDIVERNTVWAEALDNEGKRTGNKAEFEKGIWLNLLKQGSKLRWVSIDNGQEIKKLEETPPPEISTPADITNQQPDKESLADLQVELTKAQIALAIEQTKDIKRKWLYFIIGIILGNLGTVLLWIQWLTQPK